MKRAILLGGAALVAAIAACGTDTGNLATNTTVDAGADTGADTSVPTATCIATTCNGHGTCAVTGSTTTCTCEAGYGGANCTECAAGSQDKDGNKVCAPACTTTTCSGHGTCNDSSGAAACTCDAGYAGVNCDTCATNYQDKDNDKTCTPACVASTCNGHGTCVDTTGTAVCTCTGAYTGMHCETAPTCQSDSCNSHGTCADNTGSIVCTCDAKYTGPACASCDTGYQDNDNDMTCSPSCSASTCNSHGTCSDTSGTAVCTCATGYTGAACDACDTGFQDNDNDGTCVGACAASTCNAHGTCSDASGTAACTCDTGYALPACNTCSSGYQDNDTNGTCEAACGASTCNSHGTCSDASGSALCTCDTGYALPACNTCASGYQDNDTNGTCEAACGASTCNSHGTCADTSGATVCTCSKGWDPTGNCASCSSNFTGAACDTCVAGKGGPNCDYDQVYGLNIPVGVNWDTSAQVPYDVNNAAVAGSFTRVAYRMTLDAETVWVEMDAFTTDKTQLGIPTDWAFDQTVSNVSVVSTAANTPSVAGPVTGILEFWPNCYSPTGGNNSLYDYDDDWAPYGTDCYGSFQVHIGTNTVFAYNRWTENPNTNSDVGFGNQATGHPDWTFAANSTNYTTRRIEVFVK